MKNSIKIIVIALVAIVLAVLAREYLPPSTAEDVAAYERLYQAYSAKPELTEQEKAELDTLFQRINSPEFLKREIIETLVRLGVFFILLVPLAIWSARRSRLDQNGTLAAGALISMIFIIAGLPIVGTLLAAVFVVSGIITLKRSVALPPGEDDNRVSPD